MLSPSRNRTALPASRPACFRYTYTPFRVSVVTNMEPKDRVERPTPGLKIRCSTLSYLGMIFHLLPRYRSGSYAFKVRRASHQHSLVVTRFVGRVGVEPTTSGLSSRHSTLSYLPVCNDATFTLQMRLSFPSTTKLMNAIIWRWFLGAPVGFEPTPVLSVTGVAAGEAGFEPAASRRWCRALCI